MQDLLAIMRRLRDPDTGCPWDIEQNFDSIAPYTLEEAYEVVDAIQRRAPQDLRDELGDLLFQVVYHAQMASERDWFDFSEVVTAISDKLIRRHPHVFADADINDAEQQSQAWETFKAGERQSLDDDSVLAGVPLALPALVRAQKLQARAARVGFDWHQIPAVLDKLQEELDELKAACENAEPLPRQHEELGDLLFSCVNLARHLQADAETLTRHASQKFETRFRWMESLTDSEHGLEALSADELEALWRQAKRREG